MSRHPAKSINALQGLEKITVSLDARSAAALEYIGHVARVQLGVRPAAAVIVRRALVALAERLSGGPVAPEHVAPEARAFVEAGQGKGTARSLTEARARLEDFQERPGVPLHDWRDLLFSSEERRAQRDMLESLERILEAVE